MAITTHHKVIVVDVVDHVLRCVFVCIFLRGVPRAALLGVVTEMAGCMPFLSFIWASLFVMIFDCEAFKCLFTELEVIEGNAAVCGHYGLWFGEDLGE